MYKITYIPMLMYIMSMAKDENHPEAYDYDYCAIRWDHVMCYYGPELGENCKGEVIDVPMTDRDRHLILIHHNLFRDGMATGKFEYTSNNTKIFGVCPNMFEVTWNYELEMFAERWANQCIPYESDSNRDTYKFKVNQNVYTRCFTNYYDVDAEPIIRHLSQNQMEEMTWRLWLGQHSPLEPEVRQLLQMIWSDLRYVGCSRRLIKTKGERAYKLYFVCNYGPAGVVHGQPPYKHSTGCCIDCICLAPYHHLCVAGPDGTTIIKDQTKNDITCSGRGTNYSNELS